MRAVITDIPASFSAQFASTCKQIGCEPLDLLSVMYSESQCRAAALNEGPAGETNPDKRYNAVGLIQFMPATLAMLGYGRELSPSARALAFRHLDATKQLMYVVNYYQAFQKQGAPWDSAGRIYQATFVPATLATSRAPTDVLVQRGGRLGWCYSANAVFDTDGDGTITIQDLTDAVHRNCKGGRWLQICERLGIPVPVNLDDGIDSIEDVQRARYSRGFDPGPIDGLDGPMTRDAVRAFQAAHGLTMDGIAGPATRLALE
jgi:hypothetical protein